MPFHQLDGEDRAKRVLLGSLRNKKVPGAYLFCGHDAEKMKAFAKELSKLLSCEKACGICLNCRKIDGMVHPDHITVVPEGKKGIIKIDRVRELKDRIKYGPAEANMMTVIIESADSIEPAAGNSLLKMLEEPPKNVLFILLSGNPDNLPATVVSRCQKIIFSGAPAASAEEVMAAEESGIAGALEYSSGLSSGYGDGERKNAEKKLERLSEIYMELGKPERTKIVLEAIKGLKKMANIRLALDSMSLKLGGHING